MLTTKALDRMIRVNWAEPSNSDTRIDMASTVATVHSDFTRRQIQWARIRDALEGSDEIKENGEAYLPKPDGMTQTAYDAYKRRAHFFPVAERTLRGLSGIVFRLPTQFKLPPRLEPLREAATTDGHSLEVLAEQIVNEVLSIGRYGLLLDYPTGNTSPTSIPYIATYTAENITDWKVQLIDGRRELTRVVLKDDFDADDEDVNDAAEQRLELLINEDLNYEVRRWVASSAKKMDKADVTTWVLKDATVPTINGKPLKRIPFQFINPYDLRPEVEKPPFLDLVDVNIALYRNSADYEHALFLTSQPTPWVSGSINEENKPTAIGSGAFWILPEGSTVGMLEFQGAGVQAMERAMATKKDEMAALGARMIHEGQNRNESSDTARMRGKSELALLTNVVNMVEAGLTRILRMAAEWTGSPVDAVDVHLNRDWIETRMDPNELNALVKAWQSGAMSHQTLYENLQRGEVARIDRSFEEEKELIEEEGGDMSMGVMQGMVAGALQQPGQRSGALPEDEEDEDEGEARGGIQDDE
ncbi:portal protein [Pseudanabaena phage Pan1]|nr:portal protein [Pseudanabaena phage Pan1]